MQFHYGKAQVDLVDVNILFITNLQEALDSVARMRANGVFRVSSVLFF